MSNFKVGQKVVFVAKNPIIADNRPISIAILPKKGEIVTINGFKTHHSFPDCTILITEYLKDKNGADQLFEEGCFRPLQYDSAISELINFKVITETSDQPMKNPSPEPETLKQLQNG